MFARVVGGMAGCLAFSRQMSVKAQSDPTLAK